MSTDFPNCVARDAIYGLWKLLIIRTNAKKYKSNKTVNHEALLPRIFR